MDKPTCYYLVKARIAILNKISSKTEFQEFTHKFENKGPILAREAAFGDYDSYIHSLLLGQGLSEEETENITDRNIRKILNPYVPKTKIKNGDNEHEWSGYHGIWVNMVIDNDEKNEITIHSISNDNSDMPHPPDWGSLEEECEFYKTNEYDTKDYAIEIEYFDIDEYKEELADVGFSETTTDKHQILRTPFDWTGYGKKYWWGEDDKREIEIAEATEESREEFLKRLIEIGENNTIEFKPTLLCHFGKKDYSKAVRYIIAKTICSFLNSNGGCLLVGVTNEKKIQGLNNDFALARPKGKDQKDYFRLEVDKILREYFEPFALSYISSEFEKVDGVEIYVFTVFPSKIYPVFMPPQYDLQGQNNKEFWVRSPGTSCEQITDIEKIVKYCLTQWNS